MPASQVGEEAFEFGFAGEARGHGVKRAHIAAEPEDLALLGREGLVLAAEDLAESLDGFGRVHFRSSLRQGVGQRQSVQKTRKVSLHLQ